jgi:hypothetical protein
MRPTLAVCAGLLAVGVPAAHASWAPPDALSDRRDTDQRAPAIARNAAGDHLAAWVGSPAAAGAGTGRVRIAERRGRDGVWSRERTISRAGVGAPAVAISPRGAAIVAWGVRGRVEVAIRPGRRARWRTGLAARGPGHVTDVAVAVDASGAMAVMWAEAIGAGHRVRRALLPPGATRFRPGASSVVTTGRPALVTGAAGNGAAAWTADGRVFLARSTPSGFERPLRIGDGDSPVPSMAMGSGGRLVVAWRTRLPGGTAVVGAAVTDEEGRVRNLGDLAVGDDPRAGMNARGDAAVAWVVSDTGGDRGGVAAVAARSGGPWRPVSVVRQSLCACRYAVADVAVDGAGGLLVAWRRYSRRAADLAAVTARSATGRRRSAAMRPAPDAAAADLATDGGPGAAALWTSGGVVGVLVRAGSR